MCIRDRSSRPASTRNSRNHRNIPREMCGTSGRTLIASAIGSRWSGGRSDGYLKGYRLRIAVVLAGVALQGERDRVHTLTLGVLTGRGTATVYVQSRHAVVPVVRLVVEEEFGSQPGAHLIIVL